MGTEFHHLLPALTALADPARRVDLAEAGIPLVDAADSAPSVDSGILRGELPGGLVATTVHKGSYEGLGEAYAALERWITEVGVDNAGAPWEMYLTDPGEFPDPADWLTEVNWPIRDPKAG